MAKKDNEIHQECVNRFVALANEMKDESIDPSIISAAVMTASGLYATYIVAGNDGGLTDTGMTKVADAYKNELLRIQDLKKRESTKA